MQRVEDFVLKHGVKILAALIILFLIATCSAISSCEPREYAYTPAPAGQTPVYQNIAPAPIVVAPQSHGTSALDAAIIGGAAGYLGGKAAQPSQPRIVNRYYSKPAPRPYYRPRPSVSRSRPSSGFRARPSFRRR